MILRHIVEIINPEIVTVALVNRSHKEDLKMRDRIKRHLGITVAHKGEFVFKNKYQGKLQSPKFCLCQNIER